jgi:hypothetical protein
MQQCIAEREAAADCSGAVRAAEEVLSLLQRV